MSVFNIQGQIISFPEDNASPDWSQGVINFASAVNDALQGAVGTYDVAPQVYDMIANSNTDVSIPNLQFPTAAVRSAQVLYYVYRVTDTTSESESGTLQVVYNPGAASGSLWEMSREAVGNTTVTFSISDTGQIKFSSPSIAGLNHIGKIGFYGKTLQQVY